MTQQLSLLIGDDHELVRDAIAQILRSEPTFSVTVAHDADSVLKEIKMADSYDVILLDVNMPGMDGLNSVEDIARVNQPGAVVVFSGQVDDAFIWKAIELGAKGYIPKTLPIRALIGAIHVIASGQTFVPLPRRSESDANKPGSRLTEIEKTILRRLPKGMTNKEIAHILNITEVMVKMHMRSICQKLHAKNRTHAAMIAQQTSII
ncbi:two-component system, NarL family, nitrate/nitrite response regulator NarP [Pseudorhodobacter antarcticus]|uniref:Two-component system, NarL family, nitrate/nitrite response regulator NarP n=1 Tax=Pseudorhodobacter antarcticus TaxID=1077947 RepID=A0A1H8P044_9RHOB|nr:response regulator transcription factor [Pseudorhodobacter antarcticus]SEO34948.1 two-component system, NarL family, nitrate/nitrite response regulator NarP [Pseudorhodobacter antarcticus]